MRYFGNGTLTLPDVYKLLNGLLLMIIYFNIFLHRGCRKNEMNKKLLVGKTFDLRFKALGSNPEMIKNVLLQIVWQEYTLKFKDCQSVKK